MEDYQAQCFPESPAVPAITRERFRLLGWGQRDWSLSGGGGSAPLGDWRHRPPKAGVVRDRHSLLPNPMVGNKMKARISFAIARFYRRGNMNDDSRNVFFSEMRLGRHKPQSTRLGSPRIGALSRRMVSPPLSPYAILWRSKVNAEFGM